MHYGTYACPQTHHMCTCAQTHHTQITHTTFKKVMQKLSVEPATNCVHYGYPSSPHLAPGRVFFFWRWHYGLQEGNFLGHSVAATPLSFSLSESRAPRKQREKNQERIKPNRCFTLSIYPRPLFWDPHGTGPPTHNRRNYL